MTTSEPSRREFLRLSALGAASGALWLRRESVLAQKPPARVVEVQSETVQREHLVDGSVLRAMVDDGIRALTGKRTADTGWKMLVAPNDVVAIKASVTVPGLSTHHALIDEVIRSLVGADVPPQNIFVWDRFAPHLARFAYGGKPGPGRGFGDPIGTLVASEGEASQISVDGYDEALYVETDEDLAARRDAHGTLSHYSNVLTKRATRIVSLPVLKSHPIVGLSGALSSLALGSVSNTARFHATNGDGVPVIADIWTQSALRGKHAVTIVDALSGAYSTGPGYDPVWHWDANRLYMSRDPVALDTVLLEALNARRQAQPESRLKTITRETGYIRRAAELAIGTADTDDIEREQLTIS